MESPTTPVASVPQSSMRTVTSFSKYLALALFVAFPFIGGFVGYMYAPAKVVEVERLVYQEKEAVAPTSSGEIAQIFNDKTGVVRLAVAEAKELHSPFEQEYANPAPFHIFITGTENGGMWLDTVIGNCDMKQEIREDLLSWNVGLKKYITDVSQIESAISCWFAGAGSETYLYKSSKTGTQEVVHFDTFECGADTNCTGVGEVERIY